MKKKKQKQEDYLEFHLRQWLKKRDEVVSPLDSFHLFFPASRFPSHGLTRPRANLRATIAVPFHVFSSLPLSFSPTFHPAFFLFLSPVFLLVPRPIAAALASYRFFAPLRTTLDY